MLIVFITVNVTKQCLPILILLKMGALFVALAVLAGIAGFLGFFCFSVSSEALTAQLRSMSFKAIIRQVRRKVNMALAFS